MPRILVLSGDSFHAAGIARAGLAPLAAQGAFAFDWIDGGGALEPGTLTRYEAVLVAANLGFEFESVGEPRRTVWKDYVASGGGMIIVHSGNAGRRATESMAALTGATFINHPPECRVELVPQPAHHLTCGVADRFAVFDEQYRMLFHEADEDVFLMSQTVHGVQSAGWTRRIGNGRICVLTPGHHLEVWLHPNFQIILRNILHWISTQPLDDTG